MRLLLISQYYSPEIGAGPARITGLSENLAKLGHSVTVITGLPNYPVGVIHPKYRGRLFVKESMNGVEVLRTWLFASPRKTTVRRLLNYVTFALSATLHGLLIEDKFDVIFASSPPLFVGVPALVISGKKQIPYIFDVRDMWPEIAILLGQIRETSFVTRLAKWLEAKLYSNASRISVVTAGKMEKLVKAGVCSNKIFVLSNGVDDEFLELPGDLVTRADLGFSPDDFVIAYAGTIGLAQGVGILLDAADRFKDDSNIKFLIIGEGVEKQVLVERANTAGLASVKFLPLQPKHKIPSFLSISDVAFVPLKSDTLTDSIPSKLYECLGVGCPVILAATGDSRDLIRKAGAGMVIEPGNVHQLVGAIRSLSVNRTLKEQYSKNGRAYVRQHYLRSDLAKQLERVCISIIEADQK